LPPLLFLRPVLFLPPLLFFPARLRFADERRLLTVAAAIRFAVFALRPRPFADFLIFSYIRLFFAPFTPRGGIQTSNRHSMEQSIAPRTYRHFNRQSALQSPIGNRQSAIANRQSAIANRQSVNRQCAIGNLQSHARIINAATR
jgi:hypothetical protein